MERWRGLGGLKLKCAWTDGWMRRKGGGRRRGERKVEWWADGWVNGWIEGRGNKEISRAGRKDRRREERTERWRDRSVEGGHTCLQTAEPSFHLP